MIKKAPGSTRTGGSPSFYSTYVSAGPWSRASGAAASCIRAGWSTCARSRRTARHWSGIFAVAKSRGPACGPTAAGLRAGRGTGVYPAVFRMNLSLAVVTGLIGFFHLNFCLHLGVTDGTSACRDLVGGRFICRGGFRIGTSAGDAVAGSCPTGASAACGTATLNCRRLCCFRRGAILCGRVGQKSQAHRKGCDFECFHNLVWFGFQLPLLSFVDYTVVQTSYRAEIITDKGTSSSLDRCPLQCARRCQRYCIIAGNYLPLAPAPGSVVSIVPSASGSSPAGGGPPILSPCEEFR